MIDYIIKEQAKLYPSKTAIKHNGQAVSYRDLYLRSEHVANFLRSKGLIIGSRVAVIMDRSIEMVILLLGINKSGAAYLPIDPGLPTERIDFLLNDAGVNVVFTSERYKGAYTKNREELIVDRSFGEAQIAGCKTLADNRSGADIFYLLYTSGSTGTPKGVAVTHRNLLNLLLSIQRSPGISSTDNMLSITTISFDISVLEIFLPLISGAQLTIVDKEIAKDGRKLLEAIKSEKVTIVQATPFTWYLMLEYGWNEHLAIKAFCGGEPLKKDLAGKLLTRCLELWNLYGPTETTIYSTRKKVVSATETITIGHPIDNTNIYILDESMRPVPYGEIGEIYISGAGVAKGYNNRPELTAEKFLDDHFADEPGQKMYRTGDLGRFDADNEIQCLGRIDHQIKIRGYRIEPEEIEHQLKTSENIKDAVVVAFSDSVDNVRLIAYVVPESVIAEQNLTFWQDAWKSRLKNVLPDYMVPNNFLVIPAIPVMINGKVDKKALPSISSKTLSATFAAPATEEETLMTRIWEENLGIKGIGIGDDFFELGGNSLIAVKVMTQVERYYGGRLPLAMLLSHPTIRALCEALDVDPAAAKFRALVPAKPYGSKVPLYIVHGIGLNVLNFRSMILRLDEEQPAYSLQAAGLSDLNEPLTTIEEIAAFYNGEILEGNPDGPYAIAGYSFGGYIAYEMVKQLKEQGKDVRLLAMFDTHLPFPTHQYSFFRRLRTRVLRLLPKFLFRIRSLFAYPRQNVKHLKLHYERRFKTFLYRLGFIKSYDEEDMPEHMLKIVRKLKIAFKRYVFKPYEVKIDLFVAKQRVYYVDEPKYLGWKKYALKGINLYSISSNHNELFDPPYDAMVAELLQKRLNEINL